MEHKCDIISRSTNSRNNYHTNAVRTKKRSQSSNISLTELEFFCGAIKSNSRRGQISQLGKRQTSTLFTFCHPSSASDESQSIMKHMPNQLEKLQSKFLIFTHIYYTSRKTLLPRPGERTFVTKCQIGTNRPDLHIYAIKLFLLVNISSTKRSPKNPRTEGEQKGKQKL